MLIASLLSGYFLVIQSSHAYGGLTTVPYEYQDKHACEQAAKPVDSYGWNYVCVPVDTHTANKEFD